MDKKTIASLWNASKIYVNARLDTLTDTDGNAITKGSDAYWEQVTKIFERTVYNTQPNYTTMHRTGAQRSRSPLHQLTTQFSTQRQQNYNILYDASANIIAQYERGTKETKAQAWKQLALSWSSQIAQQSIYAGMTILLNMLLRRVDDYRDENGDFSKMEALKSWGWEILAGFTSNPVYGTEIYNAIMFTTGNSTREVVSVGGVAAVQSFVEKGDYLFKAYDALAAANEDGDTQKIAENARNVCATGR